MNNVEKVGTIAFDNHYLDVYDNIDNPLFKAVDVARLIDYSIGNTWKMLEICEHDEKLLLPIVVGGQRRTVSFVTELGLYNILSQSRKPIARKWRRVVHTELINMRKNRDIDISGQFDKWNDELDDVYYDKDMGIFMQSITMPDGDVEQIEVHL